jgi:hypothetical protein
VGGWVIRISIKEMEPRALLYAGRAEKRAPLLRSLMIQLDGERFDTPRQHAAQRARSRLKNN